jgi:hypothetical protein
VFFCYAWNKKKKRIRIKAILFMGIFLWCRKPSSFSGSLEQKLHKGWVDFCCTWVRRCFSAMRVFRLVGIRVVRRGLLVGVVHESWEKKIGEERKKDAVIV